MDLREAISRDHAVGRISAWRPSTTAEAYTVYLSDRRRALVADIDTLGVLEAKRRGNQIRGLGVIADKLAKALKCQITVEKALTLARPTQNDSREAKEEWIEAFKGLIVPSAKVAETVLKELVQLFDLAEEGIIRGEDIETWQALYFEVRHLRGLVENCDTGLPVVTPAPERFRHVRRSRPAKPRRAAG